MIIISDQLRRFITEEQYREIMSILLPTFPFSNQAYCERAVFLLYSLYPHDFFDIDYVKQYYYKSYSQSIELCQFMIQVVQLWVPR